MKTKIIRTILVGTGAVFLAGNAVAQTDSGWNSKFQKRFYIGLGGGSSMLSPKTTGTIFSLQDDADTAGAVHLGMDFSRRLSVELDYVDLGRATLVDDTAVPSEIGYAEASLSGLYYLWNGFADDEYLDYDGLDRRAGLSVFGRLGVGQMNNTSKGNVQYERANDFQLLAGLGVEYGLENGLGARAEYIRFDTDAEYGGLSLLYRFGGRVAAPIVLEPELPLLPPPNPISTLPPPPPPPVDESLMSEPEPATADPITTDMVMNAEDSDADGVEDSFDTCPGTLAGTPVNSNGCEFFNGVIEGVNFVSGSDKLTAGARMKLDEVVGTLDAFPGVQLSVEAHTDSRGSEQANLDLSRLRALAVVRYLLSQGIDIDRLQARAYGESRPIADNTTSDGRVLNRRVEFRTL